MPNTYIAHDEEGHELARFRSVDYDPHDLIARFGGEVWIHDETDGMRRIAHLHACIAGCGRLGEWRAAHREYYCRPCWRLIRPDLD
jgi:hypothetical protein